MANEQNLIPFNQRTESEQREIQSMGGVASGTARRRKRALKDAADLYMSLPVRDGRRRNALIRDGLESDEIDNQMAMIAGLAKSAQAGDAQSAKLLIALLEEGGAGASSSKNNLIEQLTRATEEDMDTDDLPEVE